MKNFLLIITLIILISTAGQSQHIEKDNVTLNAKADGYHGIWYMNTPLDNEYRYKYSGGLATYTAKHRPFAIYCKQVNKTFFCYGGTSKDSFIKNDLSSSRGDHKHFSNVLLMMVSYFDHRTGKVPRPTILLDKGTRDAHDNPVISIDSKGFIWIFSTSHGTNRPSYIHKSLRKN